MMNKLLRFLWIVSIIFFISCFISYLVDVWLPNPDIFFHDLELIRAIKLKDQLYGHERALMQFFIALLVFIFDLLIIKYSSLNDFSRTIAKLIIFSCVGLMSSSAGFLLISFLFFERR